MTRKSVVVAASCALLLTGGVSAVFAQPECRRLGFIAEYVNVPVPGPGDVAGLDNARGVAMSPDGACVYAAGFTDDAVVVFSRDASTGALTYLENHSDGDMSGTVDGLNGATAVVVTPDNASGNGYVYVAGHDEDRIAIFEQQPGTCRLTYLGTNAHVALDGPSDLALTADGDLFVANNAGMGALLTFTINASGFLVHLQTLEDDDQLVTCVDGAEGVAVSADGNCVYVAGRNDDAICVFTRDATTGLLGPTQHFDAVEENANMLNGVTAVAASADNKNVYATAELSDAITVTTRQAPSTLDPNGCKLAVTQELTGGSLNAVRAVTLHPADTRVYVVSDTEDAITNYKRDTATGVLSSPIVTASATILNGVYDVVTNGVDLYTANSVRDSVAAYEVDDCCGDGTVHIGEICDHPVCCSADCSTPSTPGTSCNADSNLCTAGDSCNVGGACVPGACAVSSACSKPCNGGPGTCQINGSICTCQ